MAAKFRKSPLSLSRVGKLSRLLLLEREFAARRSSFFRLTNWSKREAGSPLG